MSLNTLPDELLDIIIRFVVADDDIKKRDTQALSKSCRRLHRFVEPDLYSTFYESSRFVLLRFLRTVATHPNIAEHVQVYDGRFSPAPSLHPWDKHERIYESTLCLGSKKELDKLEQNIRESGKLPSKWVSWSPSLINRDWDAATALTLALLPNLQNLTLVFPRQGRLNDYAWKVLDAKNVLLIEQLRILFSKAANMQKQNSTSAGALSNLRKIEIVPYNEVTEPTTLSELAPFFQLKSVKKVKARNWEFNNASWLSVPVFPTVILELRNTSITNSVVPKLISSFPFLRRLLIEHSDVSQHHQPFCVDRIVRCLVATKPPLRELYLWDSRQRRIERKRGINECFSSFKQLKILEVPAFDMWTQTKNELGISTMKSLLPPNVKFLTFRRTTIWTVRDVLDLLGDRAKFPKLEMVTFRFSHNFKRAENTERLLIQVMYEGGKCGVRILVSYNYGHEEIGGSTDDVLSESED